jgi:hypothetical protein
MSVVIHVGWVGGSTLVAQTVDSFAIVVKLPRVRCLSQSRFQGKQMGTRTSGDGRTRSSSWIQVVLLEH